MTQTDEIQECLDQFNAERVLAALRTFSNWTTPQTTVEDVRHWARVRLEAAVATMEADDTEVAVTSGCIRATARRNAGLMLECIIETVSTNSWTAAECAKESPENGAT